MRWLANVPGSGSGRIGGNDSGKIRLFNLRTEDRFCHRRAADIAQAHKQHANPAAC
jgi:hypothetical protein